MNGKNLKKEKCKKEVLKRGESETENIRKHTDSAASVRALMTVYYPCRQQLEHAKRCLEQVDALWICDNSPYSSQELFAGLENCTYCLMPENLGLSAAFNRLLKDDAAGWSEDDFLLFLDQDSVLAKAHVKKLVWTYQHLKKAGIRVGCIGPVYYNKSSKRIEVPRIARKISRYEKIVSSIITSSMLCTYGDLRSIGFWNEKIFLDMADWDVCWRFQKAGYVCCLTGRIIFRHAVGEGEKRAGFLRIRTGKPFREYYETRDCLTLLGETYTPFRYRIRFLSMLTVRPLLHVLFLDEPEKRMYYIRKGIHDFQKGVYGRLTNDRFGNEQNDSGDGTAEQPADTAAAQ